MSVPVLHLPDWVSMALWAVGALAIPMLFWALLGDWFAQRRLRARRCPRCWYSMAGVPGRTCPECGFVARSERHLLRTRRRWGMACAAVALIAGAGLSAWSTTQRARLVARAMPDWLLLLVTRDPCVSPPGQARAGATTQAGWRHVLAAEVWRRDGYQWLALDERRQLAERQFDHKHHPLLIHTRKVWPVGHPVWAQLRSWGGGVRRRDVMATSEWPGADTYAQTHATLWRFRPGFEDEEPSEWPDFLDPREWSDRETVLLGVPPATADHLELRVDVSENEELLWTRTLSEPIQMVPTIEEAIGFRQDSWLSERIREHLEDQLRVSEIGDRMFVERLEILNTQPALALRIELVENGEVRCFARTVLSQEGSGVLSIRFEGRTPPDLRTALADPRWTVRVTGDPELALSQVDASTCWTGAFEMSGGKYTRTTPEIVRPLPR